MKEVHGHVDVEVLPNRKVPIILCFFFFFFFSKFCLYEDGRTCISGCIRKGETIYHENEIDISRLSLKFIFKMHAFVNSRYLEFIYVKMDPLRGHNTYVFFFCSKIGEFPIQHFLLALFSALLLNPLAASIVNRRRWLGNSHASIVLSFC